MQPEKWLSNQKPWIFIDRVLRIEQHRMIVTRKLITASDFFLIGHFPDFSVYPGVLLFQGMVQSASVLKQVRDRATSSPAFPPQIQSSKIRFLRAVVPGETIEFTVHLEWRSEGELKFHAKGKCGNSIVVRANWIESYMLEKHE